MSRASRKDRKVQRERVTRAVDRGLPAPTPELRRSVRVLPMSSGRSSDAPPSVSDVAPSKNSGGWFSSWPLTLKLVSLATLVLLGIGLWRTLTSRNGQ